MLRLAPHVISKPSLSLLKTTCLSSGPSASDLCAPKGKGSANLGFRALPIEISDVEEVLKVETKFLLTKQTS